MQNCNIHAQSETFIRLTRETRLGNSLGTTSEEAELKGLAISSPKIKVAQLCAVLSSEKEIGYIIIQKWYVCFG
jgi:hypothetical protein